MTIHRVAKAAGVSHVTVSRAINGHPNVTPATVSRVHEAMRQVGYIPAARRRGRKRTPPGTFQAPGSAALRTGNIGLMSVWDLHSIEESPLVATILQGVQSSLAEQGLNLMIAQFPSQGSPPPMLANRMVDGLLLHGLPADEHLSQELRRFPTVWVMTRRPHAQTWGDCVQPNNAAIGRMAARYLTDQGRRHLAFVASRPGDRVIRQRGEAFAHAAQDLGVSVEMLTAAPSLDDLGSETRRGYFDADEDVIVALIDRLLALDPRPDGLFLPNDHLTFMAHRALTRRGIRPEQDITLIACNHTQLLLGLEPRPATIDIQPRQIGEVAVRQLLWRLHHPSSEHPETVIQHDLNVSPQLIEPEPTRHDVLSVHIHPSISGNGKDPSHAVSA